MRPEGGIGPGIVYTHPYKPLKGPYFWWNTRDWVTAGSTYPFTSLAPSVRDYLSYFPNRGVSGSYYDMHLEVTYSASPPTWDIDAYLDHFNWPPPNNTGALNNPVTVGGPAYPYIYNYLSPILMDDLGGPLEKNGPICCILYMNKPFSDFPNVNYGNADFKFYGFDFKNGWILYLADYDNYSRNAFMEWFDYVHDNNNFSEIRGPQDLPRDKYNFKLLTFWEDCGNGVGDILLDHHSFWDDPNYNGQTASVQDRGDIFDKAYSGGGSISPANDPDTVYMNYNGPNTVPQEFLVEMPSVNFNALPTPGSMWPEIGAAAWFRGIPTAKELDQIKADMIAGGTPTYFRVHPPTNPSSITTTGHMSDTRSDICWSSELGIFVAVGGNAGRATTSPDGITWTDRTSPTVLANGVCWSPDLGLFVMVGSSGVGSKISTSPDGINWTGRTAPGGLSPDQVCWAPELGLFCIAGTFSGATNIATSPNGINWTLRTNSPSANRRAICWSPQLHLFCSVGAANSCSTSPDGITWTSRAIGSTSFGTDYLGICWSPLRHLFVAVGNGTQFKTSPDGITWTTRNITDEGALDWRDVCWGGNEFIAIGFSGSFPMAYSKDGINWQGYSFSAGQWEGIAYSPELGKYVCVESGSPYGVVTIP